MLMPIIMILVGGLLTFGGTTMGQYFTSSSFPQIANLMGYTTSIIGVVMVITGVFNLTKYFIMGGRGYGSYSFSSSSSTPTKTSVDIDIEIEETDENEVEDEIEDEELEIEEKEELPEIKPEPAKKLKIGYYCQYCGTEYIPKKKKFSGFLPKCPNCGGIVEKTEKEYHI